MSAVSVDFRPIKYTRREGGDGYDFQEVELPELSAVPVPAYPGALLADRVGLHRADCVCPVRDVTINPARLAHQRTPPRTPLLPQGPPRHHPPSLHPAGSYPILRPALH